MDSSFYEDNISKLLYRSILLFRDVGSEELAEKWEKILKNYNATKKVLKN